MNKTRLPVLLLIAVVVASVLGGGYWYYGWRQDQGPQGPPRIRTGPRLMRGSSESIAGDGASDSEPNSTTRPAATSQSSADRPAETDGAGLRRRFLIPYGTLRPWSGTAERPAVA